MSQVVYIGKKKYTLQPSQVIGKGGEADIYRIGSHFALKLFKPPDHPDFSTSPGEQKGAVLRIQEHQEKLKKFPDNLSRVVAPQELARSSQKGSIVGYLMELITGADVLLRFRENSFRNNGVRDGDIVTIFQDIHSSVRQIHEKGVVLGDFNDLNVLVRQEKEQHGVYLIDADSYQFGGFLCRTFTETFVDPLLCDPAGDSLVLIKAHNEMSDWYAYTIMLMQTLLCLARGPYGGVHKPKDRTKRVSDRQRPLKRITVFNPEIRYPKPARPLKSLPDPLLGHFEDVFEKDKRTEFPVRLLKEIQWTTCSNCGKSHARGVCPFCSQVSLKSKRFVSDSKVQATRLFQTNGKIVHSTVEQGRLCFLYYDPSNQFFLREPGHQGCHEKFRLHPGLRFILSRQRTAICTNQRVDIFSDGEISTSFSVDTFRGIPAVAANQESFYFIYGGELKKTSSTDLSFFDDIGKVLTGQSIFWVGEKWGFGFYLADTISQCFVFSSRRKGINDTLRFKPFKGKLLDARCVFDDKKIWFFLCSQVGGQTVNNCHLLDVSGQEIASAEDFADSGDWLGRFGGSVAVGGMLLVPTDDGILRVKEEHGRLFVDKEFPETSKLVHSGKKLLVTEQGLVVVGSKSIWQLVLK